MLCAKLRSYSGVHIGAAAVCGVTGPLECNGSGAARRVHCESASGRRKLAVGLTTCAGHFGLSSIAEQAKKCWSGGGASQVRRVEHEMEGRGLLLLFRRRSMRISKSERCEALEANLEERKVWRCRRLPTPTTSANRL